MSLAYEATLRWDDYKDMVFGDFIVTHEFVRVFLVDTKTNVYKNGQWATFAVSERPNSAYQLLQRLIRVMTTSSSKEVRVNMSDMPSMFRTTIGSFVDASSFKISYNEFLTQIEDSKCCCGIGSQSFWNPFSTNRIKNGSVHEWHPRQSDQPFRKMEV